MKTVIGFTSFILLASLTSGAPAIFFPNVDFGKEWIRSRKQLKPTMRQWKQKIDALDLAGRKPWCLQQQWTELSWLIQHTDRQEEIGRRLEFLQSDLTKGIIRAGEDAASALDGSWGSCYSEWFFKLDTSVDHILDLAKENKLPPHPARFLDRINSPELLKRYLDSLLISDIAHRRQNHRKELNYAVPGLLRLVLRHRPTNYPFHPDLESALLEFITRTQNPETGWWGAWYRHEEKVIKMDDLSVTFHLASYLDGRVPRRGRMAKSVLKNRALPYPYGLMEEDRFTTHHNYDAVRLIRYGWSELTPKEQAGMRELLQEMLQHALTQALQPDGSFLVSPADDTVGDAYYFGVSLLEELGFFSAPRAFWTTQNFLEAGAIRQRILHRIQASGDTGLMMKNARQKLEVP